MSNSHIPFWIAADLLAQARAHGVELPEDFTSQMRGIVSSEQQHWMTERRDAEDEQRREARRRESQRRGWF